MCAQSMTWPLLQDTMATKGSTCTTPPEPQQTIKDQLTWEMMQTGWGYGQKRLPEAAGSEMEEEWLQVPTI